MASARTRPHTSSHPRGTVQYVSLFSHGPAAFPDMATCTRTVWKVLAGCQRQLLRAGGPAHAGVSQTAPRNLPVRTFAAVKALKKDKKEDTEKEVKKQKRVIDDKDRHKPYGKTAWAPVDDVYIMRYYPRTIYDAADAIDMLKNFQVLDFTPREQPVYIDLRLNMKLEKKKKVDSFVSTVHLPHPFKTQMNKVLVFTEDANQAKVARENGAVFAGGAELIQPILDDEISADFYIAVPDILPKLVPLKNKLRKKFPKSKRGSVGIHISKMLELFKTGHEYMVESDCYIRTQIAMLDMPKERIFANLQTILIDVCSHRPADMGPFIERAIIASHTSEALWFKSEDVLPKPAEEKQE
ncbi:39S ribosomal protein L1, mitochondrial isoform X3 [Siniperca chuatsi]|uniref:39S ribosomal protein L1, mitochondrial isoform X3 n=1 Tax=Siniperca chuatsi TaxID=119488 RepID=UPI001CE0AD5F|nr:39S ribosomal protein L1, mitochondrial isoform X3 [Siniperca chuatsi]XP_044051174.1 39S ribosomal protein L1, mitochondrial isoform X3 [Siniperca chuatsi]